MRKLHLFIPVIGLALVACGAGGPTAAQPTIAQSTSAASTSQPTQAPAPVLPTEAPAATSAPQIATPRATPEPQPIPQAEQPDAQLVQQALAGLAQHLGVSADQLTLQSAAPQQWPDGSLGCPGDGMVYPQVITPGFLLTLTDNARTYAVHTGERKEQIVLCENEGPINLAGVGSGAAQDPAPKPTSGAGLPGLVPATPPAEGSAAPFDENSKKMLELAQQALARELNLQAADATLITIAPVEWSDGSLGCPKPGMNYLQVITPGYQITLEAQGQRYEYHTDQRGAVVRCDQPRP
jgi:hypothetical protein